MNGIAVIGAGQMGAGIARLLARAGNHVRLHDTNPILVSEAAAEYVATDTQRGSLRAAEDFHDAVREASIVFEAIPENLDLKAQLYKRIEAVAPAATIASNTSTFLPSQLAATLNDPSRLLVAHFFNPPEVVPLVELIPSAATDPNLIDTVEQTLLSAGKQPLRLQREIPGFIANRLQAALLREALHLASDGIASFADIDQVVTSALGPRWAAAGPFQIADLGGLDVWAKVAEQLFPTLASTGDVPQSLRNRATCGNLGSKTGIGFYTHSVDEDEQTKGRIIVNFRSG